jgi:magnesium transporter
LRPALVAAIGDLIDGDVLSEMNDWVRETLVDALTATQVADIASELDTDDAVAIIEDMEPADQREVLRALVPTIARRSRKRCPIPRSPPGG